MDSEMQNYEANTYELVEYFTRRPKCSRCEYLKTFSCEHKTPVRDYMIVKYLDEGKHYLDPKVQVQVSPLIRRLKYSAMKTRNSNDSQIVWTHDNSNQCARCKQMNAFICEHSTQIRDNLFEKYNEEGRFYTPVTPKPRLKQISNQPNVKSKNNLKSKSTKTFNSDLIEESEENLNESTRITFLNEKTTTKINENEKKERNLSLNKQFTKTENDLKKPVTESKQIKDKLKKAEEPKKSGGCCSVM